MWSQKPPEAVSEVQNFPGGTCPQIPLVWVHYRILEFPPLRKIPVLIPAISVVSMVHVHAQTANTNKSSKQSLVIPRNISECKVHNAGGKAGICLCNTI